MRRFIAFALMILFAALTLSAAACGRKEQTGDAAAEVDYSGFTFDGSEEGGGDVARANLYSIDVSTDGGDTVLKLDFVSDSKLSGNGTQRDVGNPPRYKVYMLARPYRLVVEFESLTYWDYERDFDYSASDVIIGTFNHSPQQGGTFRFYADLDREAAFSVSSNDSVITVTLRPVAKTSIAEASPSAAPKEDAVDVIADETAPDGFAFYVVANAYKDFCEGIISVENEMSPVLAQDKTNIMLISKAFSSKNAADELMQSILSRESGAVATDWSVIKLEDGTLPPYSSEMDYMAAFDVKGARIAGEETKLEVVIPDGLFLAMTPDNSGLLYSRRVSEYEAGGGVTEYELLYVQSLSGSVKQLVDFQFQKIESARYSPDGRKLAVLERSGESAHLYIFDVDSRDLITDLSAVGFGDTVSAYCWDSMGGRIFSIGGSNGIVINQYDFNVPSENGRYSVVDKKGVDESSLGFMDGEVYFCETTLDEGAAVYRVKPEGGLRKKYIDAEAFAFSDDGRYLAYANTNSDFAGADETAKPESTFAILDLANGETIKIDADFSVYTFMWSKDASLLFYFENMLSGDTGEGGDDAQATGQDTQTAASDPYPYRLWVYDTAKGESRQVADLTSTNIGISAWNGRIYVCYTDNETMGDVVRATYVIDISME